MSERKSTASLIVQVASLALVGAVFGLGMKWRDDYKAVARSAARPTWEYKVVRVSSEGPDRWGASAMRFASVTPDAEALDALGAEGWELVTSYLEMETAYPNFGNDKYVTGLQPNIRPQSAVLIFRRRVN